MAGVYIANDNTAVFKALKNAAIQRALVKIGLVAEANAKIGCPVDTGRLRASITNTTDGSEFVTVGTNVSYAQYVEMGTSKATAQPFLRPAAKKKSDYAAILKDELMKSGTV